MITVLFTSAGSRLDLMNCFRQDASELKLPLRVLAASAAPEHSAACHSADRCFRIPAPDRPGYIAELLDICGENNVDLLVPTSDSELEILAEDKRKFAGIGTRVHISTAEIVRIAGNKLLAADWLSAHRFPQPRIGPVLEMVNRPEEWQWPLLLTSIRRVGSRSNVIARNMAQLKAALEKLPDPTNYVIQELVSGTEFTMDLFFDHSGLFRCAVPVVWKESPDGEASRAYTWRHPTLMQLADQLGTALKGAIGGVSIRAILTSADEALVVEINPRLSDGYPLVDRAGAKFSKWLLQEVSGQESSATNEWEDRLMMLRYESAIFLPAPDEHRDATLFWLNPGPPV